MSRAPPATGPGSTKGREGRFVARRWASWRAAGPLPSGPTLAVGAATGRLSGDDGREHVTLPRTGRIQASAGVFATLRRAVKSPWAGRPGWHRGPRLGDRGGAP
jgi:hypothetical protein